MAKTVLPAATVVAAASADGAAWLPAADFFGAVFPATFDK